ncbi:MAG: alpha-L-rhamnosidase [Ruminococcaceae bacterium]|nr:alpha-L-rhamnosidase [Oscillospiraceae bacterium]
MLRGNFITLAEFAYLPPLDVYHRESEPRELSHPDELKNLYIHFRHPLTVPPGRYERIRMDLTADDYYKLYIDGNFIAQGPAQGYPFRYQYNSLDITEYLHGGENMLTAVVHYQGLINRAYNSGDLRCGLIGAVIGILPDGSEEVILETDETWECAVDRSFIGTRRIAYDTQFSEDRDLRIPLTPWERARLGKTDLVFADEPVGTLDVHEIEAVGEIIRDGSRILDFGRETTATLRITVRAHDGSTVRIRMAEELANGTEGELTPETEIRYKTRANCHYEETVILCEGENLIDQYEYKAFRYAELLYGDDVEIVSVCAVERHWPFDDEACQLETSDPVLSAVFDICKTGVKLGAQEVFVDCPGREKGQYAGDLTITSASHLWLTGDTRLFVKAVKNQMESAFIDEGLMAVTPGSYSQEIADYSLQFPILALRYWDFTGDEDGLREMLEVCDRLLSYFEKYQREDGLLDGVDCKWNLVDWPTMLRDDYDFPLDKPIGPGVHNVINAFYVGAVICTEKIIDILGIKLEEGARRSEALIEAFNRCFYREESGLYADSETSDHTSLHANVLPAYFGFAKPEAHGRIADLIRKKGFNCGVYMAYFVLKALCRMNLYTDAYRLLTDTSIHSWYQMIREGATTCFEAWGKDQKWNTSLCHPWASAPISVLIEDILGVTPKTPGFADVDVRPHIPRDVESLEMRIPLPDNRHIEFEWERGFYNYRILKND